MLPSINLQLTDFTAFNGDLAAEPQVSPDADTPVAGFAELLNQPMLIDDPTVALEAGEALPQDGNMLPSDLSESLLMPEEIAGEPIKGDGIQQGTSQGELPIVRMVPPGESSNQTASLVNQEAQVLAASIPTRPEQGQRAGMHAGAASVAAELESLVSKPASANTLSTSNQVMTDRVSESDGEMRQAAALDRFENTIRPATILDPDAIKEGRPTVSGSSPDSLAGLVERWQGSSSTQPFSTTPQPLGIASGLTLGTHAPLAASATPLPTPINTPLHDAAWGDALSDRVLFMTGQKIHNAEIRLNPAELGPITITVAVDDGAADVTFTAKHAVAREAIELAMPRLRELLSENGLQLGNASVAEQGVDQDAKGRETQEAQDWNGVAGDVLVNNEAEQVIPLRMPQGLLDTFA